jgi:maleylacetate reductase
MQEFEYEALPVRVVFGRGAARARLADEVDRRGAARALVVASPSEEPLACELAETFAPRVAGVFAGVGPHVPIAVTEAARAQVAEVAADAVFSVGGDSTTGTAKAVALITGLPITAVPTTYSGSEVTSVWA